MYKNAAQSAAIYRRQQIMTASPAELTLMLYNGAIKFTNEAIKALEAKDYEQKNTSCIKVQNIISEFQVTLKTDWELAPTWMALYDYIKKCIIAGNIKNDAAKLEEAKELITEFRDTWVQIMKRVKEEQADAQAGAAGLA